MLVVDFVKVVYLLIPTSNHNCNTRLCCSRWLYIFWFLHQTTTSRELYIEAGRLYIFWFLHQTTTPSGLLHLPARCISFDSYIKPQRSRYCRNRMRVVYLLIPTSNHNRLRCTDTELSVVYLLIPTSNHNRRSLTAASTVVVYLLIPTSNHNFLLLLAILRVVVYLLIPTSNHNIHAGAYNHYEVVYLLIPTSNHNRRTPNREFMPVVYLLIPTSNHNLGALWNKTPSLYIFWFLHQTTTLSLSFRICLMLYIFWFLHQTTTGVWSPLQQKCCISFDSYIKPQLSGRRLTTL